MEQKTQNNSSASEESSTSNLKENNSKEKEEPIPTLLVFLGIDPKTGRLMYGYVSPIRF